MNERSESDARTESWLAGLGERGIEELRREGEALEAATPSAGPRPRGMRWAWPLLLVAAAAVLVWLLPRPRPADTSGLQLDAGGFELLAPVGPVGRIEEFVWKGDRGPGGRYEVVVLSEDGSRVLLQGSTRETRWRPSAKELAGLPDTIRWEVRLFDGDQLVEVSETAAARRSP